MQVLERRLQQSTRPGTGRQNARNTASHRHVLWALPARLAGFPGDGEQCWLANLILNLNVEHHDHSCNIHVEMSPLPPAPLGGNQPWVPAFL